MLTGALGALVEPLRVPAPTPEPEPVLPIELDGWCREAIAMAAPMELGPVRLVPPIPKPRLLGPARLVPSPSPSPGIAMPMPPRAGLLAALLMPVPVPIPDPVPVPAAPRQRASGRKLAGRGSGRECGDAADVGTEVGADRGTCCCAPVFCKLPVIVMEVEPVAGEELTLTLTLALPVPVLVPVPVAAVATADDDDDEPGMATG